MFRRPPVAGPRVGRSRSGGDPQGVRCVGTPHRPDFADGLIDDRDDTGRLMFAGALRCMGERRR